MCFYITFEILVVAYIVIATTSFRKEQFIFV